MPRANQIWFAYWTTLLIPFAGAKALSGLSEHVRWSTRWLSGTERVCQLRCQCGEPASEARSNTATSLAFQFCAGLARLQDVRPDFLHDDLIWSG